jgi:hypothetical protein
MASIIKVETLQDTAGNNAVDMQYVSSGSAKHWAHITGDGTPSLLDSLNCSSVTDYAVAWVGSNLTNNMSDTNGSFFWSG